MILIDVVSDLLIFIAKICEIYFLFLITITTAIRCTFYENLRMKIFATDEMTLIVTEMELHTARQCRKEAASSSSGL